MMRMFIPILMKTWLKMSVTTPTASNLAQAIARLAGDSDSGEQNHGVKREHDHAADESFLLGNDRENEIVVRHGPGQVTQGILRALAASLCPVSPPEPTEINACRTLCESSNRFATSAFQLCLRRTGRQRISDRNTPANGVADNLPV